MKHVVKYDVHLDIFLVPNPRHPSSRLRHRYECWLPIGSLYSRLRLSVIGEVFCELVDLLVGVDSSLDLTIHGLLHTGA